MFAPRPVQFERDVCNMRDIEMICSGTGNTGAAYCLKKTPYMC